MEHFDLIILGAGPGGYTAALEAAKLKKSVLLIESREVGGTCLNRGCIPTKALLRSARLYREMREGEVLGITSKDNKYDLSQMSKHASEVQTKLRDGISALLNKGGVKVIEGLGKVTGEHLVSVNDESFEGDNIMIATGSVPAIVPIKGVDSKNVVTSDDLLNGEGVDCKSIIIIGGGVVGVEFAQVYNDLGADVTIIEALPRLLFNLDRELGQSLAMSFKKRGINIYTGAMVNEIAESENGLSCTFTDKKGEETVNAEYVLVCTGRRPNTKNVLPEDMENTLGMEKGYIPTNDDGRTKIESIWAIGDIVMGGIQLAHAAEAQGRNAVCAMFGEEKVKDAKYIPSCIFTDPEISCVGMSLDEAKEKGIDAASAKKLSTSNGKAMIDGADRGFVKLVYRKDDEVVIGAQLLCPHSSEMIGCLTSLIRAGLTLSDIEKTVFPHPTVSEVIGE